MRNPKHELGRRIRRPQRRTGAPMRGRRCDAALTRPHICELVVSELITHVDRYASGPMWASVDWFAAEPTIRVAHVGPGFDLQIQLPGVDSVGGRGLFIVDTSSPGSSRSDGPPEEARHAGRS